MFEKPVSFFEAVSKTTNINVKKTLMDKEQQENTCDIELKRLCGSVLKINAQPISVVTNLITSFVGS